MVNANRALKYSQTRWLTRLSGPQTPTLTCDALSRLTSASATGGPANYTESYAYNAATGNLEIKGAWTLAYTDPNHPHAVTTAGGNTYAYDANGNQVTRVIGSDSFTLLYDAENRLVEVKKNGLTMASFAYDGDGKRVMSVIGGETILFVSGHYEVVNGSATKYYFAGAGRLAMRQNGTLYFLLSDHLGSTSLTLDANGNKLAGLRYTAWGAVRHTDGVTPTPYTFTGQYSHMAQFGLMFFNARWLDPALGRFAQADTLIPEASQGAQAWDRYAFVNNNPIRHNDPVGHFACGDGIDNPLCEQHDPSGSHSKRGIAKEFVDYFFHPNICNDLICQADYWSLSVYSAKPLQIIYALIADLGPFIPAPDELVTWPGALAILATTYGSVGITITVDKNGFVYLSPGVSGGKTLIESITGIPYISLTTGYLKEPTASPDQISSLLKGVSISHGGSGPVIIPAGNFVWSTSSPTKSVEAGFATPGINVFTVAYGISIDDILSDLFSH